MDILPAVIERGAVVEAEAIDGEDIVYSTALHVPQEWCEVGVIGIIIGILVSE